MEHIKLKRVICLMLCLCLFSAVMPALSEEIKPADFSDRFEDRFLAAGETPVTEDFRYISENLFIEIAASRVGRSDVYVADIYVRDLSSLRRGFGAGKWRTQMRTVKTIAEQEHAILALTGDNGHNFSKGVVFANGQRLRRTTNNKRDVCLIYMDGSMEVIGGRDLSKEKIEEITGNVWQSFLFGPALLDKDGKAITKFNSGVAPANPRAVIGYYEPGHYCLVQVDGRGTKSKIESGKKSVGMKLTELAAFMEELGCAQAYNLDGGQSALMWFNGKVVSTPYHGGRTVGDIVYLAEPAATESAQ